MSWRCDYCNEKSDLDDKCKCKRDADAITSIPVHIPEDQSLTISVLESTIEELQARISQLEKELADRICGAPLEIGETVGVVNDEECHLFCQAEAALEWNSAKEAGLYDPDAASKGHEHVSDDEHGRRKASETEPVSRQPSTPVPSQARDTWVCPTCKDLACGVEQDESGVDGK